MMTLNETIMQLVMLTEHPAMPKGFQPTLDKIIEALSELEPEPHWTPCSERPPKEETDVLVTRTFFGCKDGIPVPKTYVEVAQYFAGEWTALSDEYKMARSRHTDPIAWMPLPEPYQPEEKSDDNFR